MTTLQNLPQVVTAIGGLGTAAFGLVDASKVLWGGVNNIGFGPIKKAVTSLTPGVPANALSGLKILATLQSNWFNGTDLASQKAIAKSLIKLNLSTENVAELANLTGVNAAVLGQVAAAMVNRTSLDATQSDVNARFDLIVTAMLDGAYQRADNLYRNWTRAIAAAVAVAFAVLGGMSLNPPFSLEQSVIVGLLATPLAPIAKDLSSALAAAVDTMQIVNKKK
jgi:hypothetical protein